LGGTIIGEDELGITAGTIIGEEEFGTGTLGTGIIIGEGTIGTIEEGTIIGAESKIIVEEIDNKLLNKE
jgi:hypothetical protein